MRKNISIWMLGAAAMVLASCSQNEDLLQTDNGVNDEVRVTFDVRTPGMQSRAIVPAEAEEATAKRYICEVYEGDDAANLTGTPVRFEQGTTEFTMLLKKNTDYVFLLWADNGTAAEGTEDDNYYNAADLKDVQVAGAGDDKCDEIAFYACKPINITSTGEIGDITLNHAVAKVCLHETNVIQPGGSLVVEYTAAQSFNVAAGTTAAATQNRTLTYKLTAEVNATGTTSGTEIAHFYVLAPEKGKADGLSNMTCTLTEPDGSTTKETTKTINNVPLQANYVTNIRGEFSDYTSTAFSVSLNSAWEEAFDYISMADFTSSQDFTDYFNKQGKNGTLKFTGDMTAAAITMLSTALNPETYSYKLDFSGVKFTDPLPEKAFNQVGGIDEIILPEGLTDITNEMVFHTVKHLKSITFPTSLQAIGKYFLMCCDELPSADLSETKVTVIPNQAFYWCKGLEKVSLGNVTEIGAMAFAYDKALVELDLSKCEQVPTITSSSFDGMKHTPLKIYVKDADLKTAFFNAWSAVDSEFTADIFVVKQ